MTGTAEAAPEAPASDEQRATGTSRRFGAVQVLALVALAAALVGAVGPADDVKTTYSWPPPAQPAGAPPSSWYTPLLLVRHQPEAISASLPCSPTPLPAATRPLTVLATARFPAESGALSVTARDGSYTVRVGERTLTEIPLGGTGDGCAHRLLLEEGRWLVEDGVARVRSGPLEEMPVVFGLFSSVDLRSEASPQISVETAPHASHPTWFQIAAWAVAFLAAGASLLLVALGGRRRLGLIPRPKTVSARPVDALVVGVLLAWWVIGPAFYDDGWVSARVRSFASSEGFSAYFNAFGANQPLGYWLEQVQRGVSALSPSLLVGRIPALVCLVAVWALCRWALSRLPATRDEQRVLVWVLAAMFLAGAFAWGMTMRPEPAVALLVTGMFACALTFRESPRAAPLAVAGLLVPFGLAAHPTGVLVLAPLLVVIPTLARFSRKRVPLVLAVCAAALALLLALVTVGADLGTRFDDARTHRVHGDANADWYHEVYRYAYAGSPAQKAWDAVLLLTVLAYLARRRGDARATLNLPGATAGISMILLLATPSKHTTHLGALVGVAAVAAAAETLRLGDRARAATARYAILVALLGGAVAAALWTWSQLDPENYLYLRTLDWSDPVFVVFAVLLVVCMIGLLAWSLWRARVWASNAAAAPRLHAATWVVPLITVPAIAFSLFTFAADAAMTDGWTMARQNVQTFAGKEGCGFADDAQVVRLDSVRQLPRAPLAVSDGAPASDRVPPVVGLESFTLRPRGSDATYAPWYALAAAAPGFFVAGVPDFRDRLEVEWARRVGGRLERVGGAVVPVDLRREAGNVDPTWRFIAAGELPQLPPSAAALRVGYRSAIAPRAALAVTAPVSYRNQRLADRIAPAGSVSLPIPNLLMYTPCAQLPRLSGGVVQVPNEIVGLVSSWPVGIGTSPFDGVFDLYAINRLPLSDTPNVPKELAVYDLETELPGSRLVAPRVTTESPEAQLLDARR